MSIEGGPGPVPEPVSRARAPSSDPDDGLRLWTDHLRPGEARRPDELTAEGTLVHAFLRRWAEAPDRPLWIEPAQEGSWWTNAAFEDATRRVACRLLGGGLEPGDRVVWSCEPSIAALAANVACLRAGLVVVPANPAYTEAEIEAVVAAVRPRGAVVDDTARAGWIRRAGDTAMVVTGPEAETLDDAPSESDRVDRVRPDDPALIGMTSGTTGPSKGALLRHRHLLAGATSLQWAWRWEADDRLVHGLPLFHAHGLCVGAYGTMAAGASGVLLGRFEPRAVAAAARDTGATLFFGVPTMYHRLLRSGLAGDLGRLRLCVSGSAPMPPDLHAAVSATVGTPVLERYGMTETLMLTSNPCEGERRPGTVGFPLPGVEVRLDPAPEREGRDQDAIGEVLVRGPNIFDGYLSRPDANAEAFASDDSGGGPWFRTGDLGAVEDGYLEIRGRAKELIISGGYNVHPGEVEAALAGCPGVAEVAVTGTPSEEFGEVVTAWVVADGEPPTLEQLSRHAATTLAPYKRPRRLHLVDGLPRTALGKVVRGRLGTPDGEARR